jgi:hypothetical protein
MRSVPYADRQFFLQPAAQRIRLVSFQAARLKFLRGLARRRIAPGKVVRSRI